MGAIAPEQKLNLSGSLGRKSTKVRWKKGAPKKAKLKKCHAINKFKPHFLEKFVHIFLNSEINTVISPYNLHMAVFADQTRGGCCKENKKITFGAWPPNLTPDPHVTQKLSSAFRAAHDPEKTFGDSSNGCRENLV